MLSRWAFAPQPILLMSKVGVTALYFQKGHSDYSAPAMAGVVVDGIRCGAADLASWRKAKMASAAETTTCPTWIPDQASTLPAPINRCSISPGQTSVKKINRPILCTTMPWYDGASDICHRAKHDIHKQVKDQRWPDEALGQSILWGHHHGYTKDCDWTTQPPLKTALKIPTETGLLRERRHERSHNQHERHGKSLEDGCMVMFPPHS